MDSKAKFQRKMEEIRRRKDTCLPKVFWTKVCFDNLNRKQREFISLIFAEARWFWNYLVSLKRDGDIPSDILLQRSRYLAPKDARSSALTQGEVA